MFKDGELVQHGKHEELVAQEGEYKEVYESQLMIDQESKIMLEDN
jgi:ABC-type multidrug transport system fused ATPase/permease subunit